MSRSVFESRRDPLRLPSSPDPPRPKLEAMPVRRATVKRASRVVEILISVLVVGFVMFWLLRHL